MTNKTLRWPKIYFFVEVTPIFHFLLYSFAKTDFIFILRTLLYNVRLPKIGPNCRILAQNSIFCLGNQIFVNGTFVALCVVTIFAVGPITIISFRF